MCSLLGPDDRTMVRLVRSTRRSASVVVMSSRGRPDLAAAPMPDAARSVRFTAMPRATKPSTRPAGTTTTTTSTCSPALARRTISTVPPHSTETRCPVFFSKAGSNSLYAARTAFDASVRISSAIAPRGKSRPVARPPGRPHAIEASAVFPGPCALPRSLPQTHERPVSEHEQHDQTIHDGRERQAEPHHVPCREAAGTIGDHGRS